MGAITYPCDVLLGIRLDFDLMGGAPRWALGPGRPVGATNQNWEPSPSAFGAFVHAIATRPYPASRISTRTFWATGMLLKLDVRPGERDV